MFGNCFFDDAFVALVHLVAKHPTFSILSSRFSPHNYRRAVYSDIIFSEIVTSLLQDFISVFLAFFPVHFLFQVVNFVFVNTFKLAPSFFWPQRISLGFCAKKCSVQMINASDVKERIQASTLCSFSDYDYTDNHKNYNFFDCDWFKNLLFYTNLLTKLLSESLLSDSFISQSHSKLKFKSSNLSLSQIFLHNLAILLFSEIIIFMINCYSW